MMESIKRHDYIWYAKNFIGKTVNFKSNCQFFPNFNVTGSVQSINMSSNNEILFDIISIKNNKHITVGSNMSNLEFRIIY